jgi:lathosterol oxidase
MQLLAHALAQIAAIGLAFGLAERLPRLRYAPLPFFRRAFASDGLHLASSVALASAALAWIALASSGLDALGAPRLASEALPGFALVPLALVLLDLGHYAVHWALHRVGPLWELHKVHHSSPTLDWLATTRSHLLEQALRHGAAPLLPIAAGFPAPAVALAAGVFALVAVTNHSNLAPPLRWLEPIFVTPRLHRLHHVPQSSERNLGVVLTLWDRLRGTFSAGDTPPATPLGVPGEVGAYPQSWPRQQLEPLRRWRRGRT